MNCELLDLRAFLAVLDLGSFNKAAQRLNLSQPAVAPHPVPGGSPRRPAAGAHDAPCRADGGRPRVEPLVRRLLDEFRSSILSTTMVGSRRAAR
jgi:hypothetical protein